MNWSAFARLVSSVEVRWFSAGGIPALIQAWFDRLDGDWHSAAARQDLYLHEIGNAGLGVKWREGLIEIKYRTGQYGAACLHDQVQGEVEAWRKWSFPLQGDGVLPERLFVDSQSWIAVQKERTLRKYIWGPGGAVEPVSPAEELEQGCMLELTRILIQEQGWWTLGFEAFGREPELHSGLLQVAGHVLDQSQDPPRIPLVNSYSYPALLQRRIQPSR